MKDRLIDLVMDTYIPIMNGDVTVGVHKVSYNMAEKIANKLIENGVTLPTFKVGDIVWVYDPMWGIVPCEIDRPYHCRCGEKGGCTFEMGFNEVDVGDYVFATKEEAEVYWHGVPEVSGKNLYLD